MQLQKYHLTAQTNQSGSLILKGLPPNMTVRVTIEPEEKFDLVAWRQFVQSFRATSPLAKMSKSELRTLLDNTRQEVADEQYPNLS